MKKHRPKETSAPILPRFMRIKEYAKHIGISDRTLRDWISDRLIPTIKVRGHLVLIDPVRADEALQRLEKEAVKI